MGLTIHYEWKTKSDLAGSRRLVARCHALAKKLPFDEVSEIFEQDPPEGETAHTLYNGEFPHGALYLPRMRRDKQSELVYVPAQHAVFFSVRVHGAESALIGLASHPPVVLHREDVIERDATGAESGRIVGQGDPIEFATRRRGYYSWHGFCKTQYAGNPKLGGEANFLKAHLSLIELLDQIQKLGIDVRIHDDSRYAKHRDVNRLLICLREWDAVVARVAGRLGDALSDQGKTLVAPIKDRPDFEHLEAKGIEVIRRLSSRQRRRKKKGE